MLDSIKIAFVVCRGRSGSTLVQSILEAHPSICAPIESKFVLHLATRYKKLTDWDAKTIDAFINDLYSNRKFRLFWKVKKESLRQDFARHEIHNFREACKVVWMAYPSVFKKNKTRLIVDKNPPYSRYLDRIKELFPDAKFIYLTREPKAVVYSHMASFDQRHSYRLSLEWNLLNRCNIRFKQKYPQSVLQLRYEDLVQNPERYFYSIFDFLDIDFSPDLLQSYRIRQKTITKNTYLNLPHHRNIAKPIDTSLIEKWRGNLSTQEIRLIDTITMPVAKELGYESKKQALKKGEGLHLFFSKIEVHCIHAAYRVLFKLPFTLRKGLFDVVSLFFDRKYKEKS